jgi:ElaB/YqjD/DUF883 family membrane-anchored ribosome-binding protein
MSRGRQFDGLIQPTLKGNAMTKSDMKSTTEGSMGDKTAQLKEAGRDMAESGKQMLSEAKSKVSEAVSGVASQAGERLDDTKNRLADQGERMAESLREAAYRDDEGGMQSRVLESVASGLTSVTDTLRSADPSAMMSSVQRFAQRNPILFATGAAVAGLLVARALAGSSSSRSSATYSRDRSYSRDDEDRSMGYEGNYGSQGQGLSQGLSQGQTQGMPEVQS